MSLGQSREEYEMSAPSTSAGLAGADGDAQPTSENSREALDNDKEGKAEEKPAGLGTYFQVFSFCDGIAIALYVLGFIMSIGAGAALPLMTIVFGRFVGDFNDFDSNGTDPTAFTDTVDTFVLWFIYLFVGRFAASYIANLAVSLAAIRTTRAIRKRLLEATLRQEIWHFDKETTGSIASQVTTNGDKINQGIAEKLAGIIQSIATFWAGFIVALTFQWKLTLIVMTLIPGIVVILTVGMSIDAGQEAKMVKIYSQAAVLAQEALSSVKTVHSFWAHEKLINRYDDFLLQAQKVGKKKSPNVGLVHSTQQFCTLAGMSLAFWQGFRMYASGEIDNAGTVLTVLLSVTIATTGLLQISVYIASIGGAASAAHELFTLMAKPSELDPLSTDGNKPDQSRGEIELRSINFAYPSRPSVKVLDEFDLHIPAGKTTALVGASGCGKSTVVGLLERWYVPESGEILLDGEDLSSYNTQWLRSNIRIVQQENILFRGSVFENVAKGLVGPQRDLPPGEQMRLVQEACKLSNAHDFIQAMPEGYQTQVGERAHMLSGGQKQRVAIARSIISNPSVLLLDEATSALDPRAEGIVQDALQKASMNRTTLVIAHKLATIKNADNIVLVSAGKMVEQGTHDQLIAKDGRYAALVRAQDLGERKARDGRENTSQQHQDGTNDALTEPTSPLDEVTTIGNATKEKDDKEALNYSILSCLRILFSEQRGLFKWFIIALPATIIAGGSSPAQAVLFSRLISVFALAPDEARDRANFFSLMFFIIAIVVAIGYFVIGFTVNMIMQAATRKYRSELFSLILRLQPDFFDQPNHASGALASKLTSVPASLQELISVNIFIVLISVASLISCSILAIAFGWKLGLVVVLVGMPVIVGSGFLKVRLEMKLEIENGERFAACAALATEAVTAIRTVASLTLEEQICAEYNDILETVAKRSAGSLSLTILGLALSQSVEFLIMALGFWYGSRLIADGEYTVPQFFVIFLAVVFGGQAAGQISGYMGSLASARHAANHLFWLRNQPSPFTDGNDQSDSTELKLPTQGPIQMDNVEFAYTQRATARVLKGINMMVPNGSYVACVGPSGCGKTTVIALLERLYDPTSGQILWDDRNIKSVSLRHLRARMSLVQQEPTLFQVSVRENIMLGLETTPSDEEILEACRQANAHDFILSLPEGLDTLSGTGGLQFSGGQRQRIAIARALIRNPQVLLLDEATSALDTETERLVQETLDDAATHRTTIAVAHRLSTIRNADRIFVFADGRVLEEGTHDELLELRGQYYEMCLAQSLDRS
ncbi:hypothetical protein ACLX1H_009731 [Fusarium chlamydosporum]